MASIRVPSNVSSMTFSTSGVKTPTAGIISGLTALEATAFSGKQDPKVARLVSAASNGDLKLSFPSLITSITIDSVVYAVSGAVTPWGKQLASAVPAVAASQVLYQNFSLVQG